MTTTTTATPTSASSTTASPTSSSRSPSTTLSSTHSPSATASPTHISVLTKGQLVGVILGTHLSLRLEPFPFKARRNRRQTSSLQLTSKVSASETFLAPQRIIVHPEKVLLVIAATKLPLSSAE